MIFCKGEYALFPEDEFVHTPDGKVFQPNIHRGVSGDHWAGSGARFEPETYSWVSSYEEDTGIIHVHRVKLAASTTTPVVLGNDKHDQEATDKVEREIKND